MGIKTARDARRNLFHPHLREPDWSAYDGIQSAELWEAVALSCGFEPTCVAGWTEPRPIASPVAVKEFHNRLRRAVAGLVVNGGQLPSMDAPAKHSLARVHLGTFRAWATANGWVMPAGFPQVVARRAEGENFKEREERIARRVEEEKTLGLSETQAFKKVALTEVSCAPGREGTPISWETVKKIYRRYMRRGTATPTTPAAPATPIKRSLP